MAELRRAATVPTRRPSGSGVAKRRVGSAKASKSARAASVAAKRKAANQKRATVKAYNAATKAVMDMREEKYFKTAGDQQFYPEDPTSGPKRCSVLAFATTSNVDPLAEPDPILYCGQQVRNLEMLRPYLATDANQQLRPYALEGKWCYPTENSVCWQINSIYTRMGLSSITAGTPGGSLPPPADSVNDLSLIDNLPIRCRIVRVAPKLAPGIATNVTPSEDLFIDQQGLPYSPASPAWSYSDCEFAAVNNRRYTVLQDTKFTLGTPFTAGWALNAEDPPNQTYWRQDISFGTRPTTKKLVTKHQLTDKKGGAVYYDQPAADPQVPSTGYRREYIFMHFWFDNADGGGDTPSLSGAGLTPKAERVKVHWRVESRFKEA